MGLNEMSDWTDEEKSKIYGYKVEDYQHGAVNLSDLLGEMVLTPVPSGVDYRMKVDIPVKQQVCSVFTALSAIEIYRALQTNQLIEQLSVQDIIDCSGLQKCDGLGGNEISIFHWVAEEGVMSAKEYPYEARDRFHCDRKPDRIKHVVNGGAFLPRDDEESIKRTLAFYGPVAIGINAAFPSFNVALMNSETFNKGLIPDFLFWLGNGLPPGIDSPQDEGIVSVKCHGPRGISYALFDPFFDKI
uniref:Peptidase C1A papain C-terminal domain-containing protein n=1 Tax=Setaria digitata TaxID=48799 RepID=A0A915PD18_9BILA